MLMFFEAKTDNQYSFAVKQTQASALLIGLEIMGKFLRSLDSVFSSVKRP